MTYPAGKLAICDAYRHLEYVGHLWYVSTRSHGHTVLHAWGACMFQIMIVVVIVQHVCSVFCVALYVCVMFCTSTYEYTIHYVDEDICATVTTMYMVVAHDGIRCRERGLATIDRCESVRRNVFRGQK